MISMRGEHSPRGISRRCGFSLTLPSFWTCASYSLGLDPLVCLGVRLTPGIWNLCEKICSEVLIINKLKDENCHLDGIPKP